MKAKGFIELTCFIWQVAIATTYGVIGMVLYSDPADYAVDGIDTVYPNAWWLPNTGIQRGTLFIPLGDPATRAYPATGMLLSNCVM